MLAPTRLQAPFRLLVEGRFPVPVRLLTLVDLLAPARLLAPFRLLASVRLSETTAKLERRLTYSQLVRNVFFINSVKVNIIHFCVAIHFPTY